MFEYKYSLVDLRWPLTVRFSALNTAFFQILTDRIGKLIVSKWIFFRETRGKYECYGPGVIEIDSPGLGAIGDVTRMTRAVVGQKRTCRRVQVDSFSGERVGNYLLTFLIKRTVWSAIDSELDGGLSRIITSDVGSTRRVVNGFGRITVNSGSREWVMNVTLIAECTQRSPHVS